VRHFAARGHPTLAAVRQAADDLRRRTPGSDRDAWARMWVRLLREHPSAMPREIGGWLASFIENELCLKQRGRGRPPPTQYRKIQTTMRVEVINARIDRWRRALFRRRCADWQNEAFRRVARETNLTVARLRKYWRRRDLEKDEKS
jgi:hypothetical protein